VQWYQDRGQIYNAYATFAPGVTDAIGYLETEVTAAGKTLNLEGEVDGICLFLPEAYAAVLEVAKKYVDAGVDGIAYDTAWVHGGAGPFDSVTMGDFRSWLNASYSLSDLQSLVAPDYSATTFDYRTFLVGHGVTSVNYTSATVDGTPLLQTTHWRLWQAFLRSREREVIALLVDEVNTYAQNQLGREIAFYFNRYGYIDRPADRWYLAEYASGDLGETHFSLQTWDFHKGYSLEPVYNATLHTYDNRFEPWNSPPQVYSATQSVFLAESLANNGVATWEDDFPDTAPIARLARRFEDQLDHAVVSDLAIFYPLATANHNVPMPGVNTLPRVGGNHYWYLGLGYIMQDLNLNYDVVFGGDGMGMPDDFSSSDLSAYETTLVAEAIQVTDNQYTELLDWVSAGGTLLVMGTNVFRYDALGIDQSGARSYGGKTWNELFGSSGLTTLGSGEVNVLSLSAWGSYGYTDQPSSSRLSTIVASISSALPTGTAKVSNTASGAVRILRFLDESDDSEVYHLINYSFNSSGSSVTAQTDFDLTFPAPVGFSEAPVASYAFSDTSDPINLTVTDNGDGTLSVTVPSLDYWGILRVGSAIAAEPHPNLEPFGEFQLHFDYEIFSVAPVRSIVFSAFDDSEVTSIQVYYQKKNDETGIWGEWTAGQIATGFGTNALSDQILDYTMPEEGHYRLQLLVTDDEGLTSSLVAGGYDTELGYDTTGPDQSALTVVVNSGPPNGGVVSTPSAPSVTVSGVEDPISGIFQANYLYGTDAFTLEANGIPYAEEGETLALPAPTEGEYGRYYLTMRFQNNAQVWDDSTEIYSYTYTLPPTYNGSPDSRTENVGSFVTFDLDYTSVFGDVRIEWFKDGELISGESEGALSL
jgi:hypothetical protein